jgi:hypothetical protein
MHQLAPARDLVAGNEGESVVLTWKASADNVLGYHIYRGASTTGPFTRLTDGLITETRFVDPQRSGAAAVYMVRAVALNAGPSGSYYNASQGVFATASAVSAASVRTEAPANVPEAKTADIVWVDDALPAGATGYATDNDRWSWISANPAPVSGTAAHQAELAAGLHHHFFVSAATPLAVGVGDTLFAYVYLDPANPPRELMLTWCAENWEHRAYWGENVITEGEDGAAGRHYMGQLPPTGRWVRLELPANAVDLENRNVIGMGFTLFDGRATWDRAGKSRP